MRATPRHVFVHDLRGEAEAYAGFAPLPAARFSWMYLWIARAAVLPAVYMVWRWEERFSVSQCFRLFRIHQKQRFIF